MVNHQPVKDQWFEGKPKIYTICDKIPTEFREVGESGLDDGSKYYAFTYKNHNYVGRGSLTLSRKGFKFLTMCEVEDYPMDLTTSQIKSLMV